MIASVGPERSAQSGPTIFVETSRALPLVSLTVSTYSGTDDDPPGKGGLTRFLFRLMRRTGGGLTPQEIDDRIDLLGGALSSDAMHSAARLHGMVISRSLEPFVEALVDVLARPGLQAEEHDRLLRKITSELVELRNNDSALARRWFNRKLFPNHAYGRPVSGTIASVSSVTQDDVQRRRSGSLYSENLAFAFAGDIDADGATRIVERISEALPRAARPINTASDPEPPLGRRLVLVGTVPRHRF